MGTYDLGLVNGTIVPYHQGENGSLGLPLNEQWIVLRPEGWSETISDLQAGTVDLIDAELGLERFLHTVEPAWGTFISEPNLEFMSLGLNMKHPVFGTGTATPNGMSYPENASLYAKYVRQAINYLIPRQAIVDSIFDGYAVAGHEYIPLVLPAYNSQTPPYRFDVAKAKDLLRMAGYDVPDSYLRIPPEFYLILFGIGVIVVLLTILVYLQWRRHRPGIITKQVD
jgi:ABC-type transport system substrate-binding protein